MTSGSRPLTNVRRGGNPGPHTIGLVKAGPGFFHFQQSPRVGTTLVYDSIHPQEDVAEGAGWLQNPPSRCRHDANVQG